jgi:hypothetical protein
MWVFVAVMIVTAVWFVLGAVVHEADEIARDVAAEVWWWESTSGKTSPASYHALPSTHPLARLTSSSHSNG